MKRNIYLMYAIAFLQGMVFYGPVATLYRQAQGVSVFQITVIESVSLILCILLEIPWGVVADKIGYKKTMIFCCMLYFLSKVVFWQAADFFWFLSERVMLSVVVAGLSGVDTSILYLSCKEEDSQKVFGIYNSLQMAGLLLAAAVFSLFVGENYKLSGLLTVISYGTAAFLTLGLMEVRQGEDGRIGAKQFKKTLWETLCNKNLLLFLLLSAFLSETHQTITVFLNQLQYEKCGLSSAAIGYIYIGATLLGGLGILSDCFTKRLGMKGAGIFFCSTAILSCVLLALTKDALLSVGGILLLRISNSLFSPFQTEIQNRQIHTEYRATALSIHAMFIDAVGVGTNLVFGALAERKLTLAYFFGMAICAVSMILFLVWYGNAGMQMIMHKEEQNV